MDAVLSHHAQSRLQQRAIPEQLLTLLLDFGRKVHDHKGCEIVFFDHQAKNRLRRTQGEQIFRKIETKLDTYAVLSPEGTVLTVGHRTKRLNRH